MKVLDIIKKAEDCFTGNGVSAETIKDAEIALNLAFSEEYRAYLKKYAVVAINGHEITGICASKRLNVVDVTIEERASNDVPADWYVIEQSNIDGIVLWQAEDGAIYQTAPHVRAIWLCSSLAEYILM